MSYLNEVITRYQLRAKKSLGQNFILDTQLLDKLARLALQKTQPSCIFEVGAGPGGLTRALLDNSQAPVYVVEKDDRCVQALQELSAQYPQRLTVYAQDALTFSEAQLGQKIVVAANLPYNVGTLLLVKWLKEIDLFERLTLMFQKEVAEHMTARVGDKAYGRLSVLVQWLCDVSVLMTLPPSAFTPAPKVYSSFVQLIPKAHPFDVSFEALEKTTRAAFSQRRKMLRSSLKSLGDPEQLCQVAGVPSSLRAEDVSVEAFCRMARFIQEKGHADRM